jgi:hypothetical protein
VQIHPGTTRMALQRLLDLLEEVFTTDQEFHRFVQDVEFFAECVFQCPGQRHDTLGGNFHRRIVAA